MQKERIKVSDVVHAQIIGPKPMTCQIDLSLCNEHCGGRMLGCNEKERKSNDDNKERKRTATEATDSDSDTRHSEDGMVGGTVRPDNPS